MRYLGKYSKAEEPKRLDYGGGATPVFSIGTSGSIEMLHSDGLPRRFTITPPWDAWLNVNFHVIAEIVATQPAGWGRCDGWVEVTPAPPTLPGQTNVGTTWGRGIAHGHAGVPWNSVAVNSWVPLTANTTYSMRGMLSVAQGTSAWEVYRNEFAWFQHGGLKRRYPS